MEIREITNKEEWEGFLAQCAEKTFLQSWNWGVFNEQMGSKIWRLGVYDKDLLAVALIYKVSARRGTFLFIPHGPVMIDGLTPQDKKEILQIILMHLTENIAEKERASFIRFSPILDRSDENAAVFANMGFREAPIHMHPEVTWELNIAPSEEEILADMRKTTRYLIRQAQKNTDIEIVKSNNIEDLKLFWPVYRETAKRHHFVVFPEKYLSNEFSIFSDDNEVSVFLGKYKHQVISAAIFVFWQGTCFYHHSGSLAKFSAKGGSAPGGNKIPVSYLLQWEAIKEARGRGCKAYNFWGIAPEMETESGVAKSRHPWAGLSLFKMGFGGYRKNYIKTQDFVLSSKYWLNFVIEKIRKHKRNL